MVSSGDSAPGFELPAIVDGEIQTVFLDNYLEANIVMLAFYPSDFNPACSDGTTGLDDLDLFTMQKDVTVLGISGDSVYSHRAFADEYDLSVPLLADVRGEVATEYGVAVEDPDAGYLTRRAVVIIGPDGEVEYVWRADGLSNLPSVDEVQSAVEAVGDSNTAFSRYRIGHAHYIEGRRAFTSAMGKFESQEWMLAQSAFERAREELEEAADHFNTAARFATDETEITDYERAEAKAKPLWQAAEWLGESASAYASGEGVRGRQLRSDGEDHLEIAREVHDPPDPDEFSHQSDTDEDDEWVTPSEAEDSDLPWLAVDIDEEVDEPDETNGEEEEPASEATADGPSESDEERIDEDELDEITAEIEEQTKAAQEGHSDELDGEDGGDEEEDEGSTDTASDPL
jgi:peroxiredoxin